MFKTFELRSKISSEYDGSYVVLASSKIDGFKMLLSKAKRTFLCNIFFKKCQYRPLFQFIFVFSCGGRIEGADESTELCRHPCFLIITSVTRLGDFCTLGNQSKLVATIILPKLPTLLGFYKGVKIIQFSREIIFGHFWP